MDSKSVLDQLPAGVWVGQVPDGTTIYVNEAFRTIVGTSMPAGTKLENTVSRAGVYDPAGQPYPVDKVPFARVMATGQACVVEDMIVHRPDGTQIPIRAFGEPVRDATGAVTGVSVTFFDISRESAAERERETLGARLSLIVQNAPVVVWSADADGIITLSEGAGLKSLGVASGQLVGLSIFKLYEGHPTIGGYIRQALAGDSFWYTVQVGDAVYDTFISPLRDARGEVTGVAALSKDVTELRSLQSAAIRDDRVKALGTLAASMAHEINNPLTYVLDHLESCDAELSSLLKAAEQGDISPAAVRRAAEKLGDHLDPVVRGAERIRNITGELRTFGHPADDETDRVDVQAMVRSALRLVGKELDARAHLEVDLRPTSAVLGNESRLVQVILNLLMNAMQALEGRARAESYISVGTRDQEGHVIIEVSDSGPGIPDADHDRIFEPFVTTKDLAKGTGLGLFVCRNIVRAAKGDVLVSGGIRGGARFLVRLPQAPPQENTPEPTRQRVAPVRESERSGQGYKVLIVDDEPLVAEVLVEKLRRAGYQVRAVHDGQQASEAILAEGDLDLVYCDLMMRGMTGMDLWRVINEKAPDRVAKMVFMTGGAFTPEGRNFLQEHADASVDKPFDILDETQRRLPTRTKV